MQLSVSRQLFEAASSFLLGLSAGFLYDFFRIIRRRARSSIVTVVCDFLFWAITGLALFLLGLSVGGGRQRIFMSVIAALAALTYFYTLSPAALTVCGALADIVVLILKAAVFPFAQLYKLLKKITQIVKNIFQYTRRWYTIGLDGIESKTPRMRGREEGTDDALKAGRYNYENSGARTRSFRDYEHYKSEGEDRRRKGRSKGRKAAGDG